MTWRYCIIRKTRKYKGKTPHHYDMHEVYLNGKGDIEGWTKEPVDCNNVEDIKTMQNILVTMLKDLLEYPVMEIRKGKLVSRTK